MVSFLWLFLLLHCGLQHGEAQGFGINLIKVADEDRGQILCTVALLEKYFHSGESLSGSVLHVSTTSTAVHVQKLLLQALHAATRYPWSIVVSEVKRRGEIQTTEFILQEKPQCYFMVIDNMEDEDMDDIFENWKSNVNWNPLAQFVVYLSAVEETQEEMSEIMIEILLNFMNKKIYNVNVIGQHEEESYYYGKSVFPYHPDNNCGNRVITIETLDICDYQEGENHEDEEEIDEDDDEEEEGGVGEEEFNNDGDGDSDINKSSEEPEMNAGESSKEVQGALDEHETDDKSGDESETATEQQESPADNTETNLVSIPTTSTPLPSEQLEVEFVNETKASGLKLMRFGDADDSENPKVYIEEMYRALFLDKFPKDLSGCPLVAAYRPWEPYIFNDAVENAADLTNNQNESDEQMDDDDGVSDYKSYEEQLSSGGDTQIGPVEIRLNGIEYKMVQTIGERLHISIDMQVENTNVYHLFQQLIDGDIEMVIGGIDEDPSISQYVSSTIPYHQDDLTWCVAKARRSYNLFNFMATFQTSAWILTLLFILTASFGIMMSQKFLQLRRTVLKSYFSINIYVMGIILSQAINLPRIPTSLQLCFGTTFFMSLIFSNVYQSFLISTLTTPKSSYQISHTEEIYESRMNVMGSVDNVRHLNKDGETFRYVREHFQMCYNIEECLQRTATDAKLAVAVSRQHSFYNPRIPRDHLYCFDRNENIYVYLVTMLLPKKFHLLHKINPVIQHIIESGHMHKWARDLDMRRKILEEIQRAHEEPFKSLTLGQVVGPFAFSNILLAFALWIFSMEHLIYWLVVRRRTRLKMFKYMHRMLV